LFRSFGGERHRPAGRLPEPTAQAAGLRHFGAVQPGDLMPTQTFINPRNGLPETQLQGQRIVVQRNNFHQVPEEPHAWTRSSLIAMEL
jgi:hypothetical protein